MVSAKREKIVNRDRLLDNSTTLWERQSIILKGKWISSWDSTQTRYADAFRKNAYDGNDRNKRSMKKSRNAHAAHMAGQGAMPGAL